MRYLILLVLCVLVVVPAIAQETPTLEPARLTTLPVGFTPAPDIASVDARLAWSHDGSRLVTAIPLNQTNEIVQLWDAETGESLALLQVPNRVTAIALSDDGSLLAVAGGRFFVMVIHVDVWLEMEQVSAADLTAAAEEGGLLRDLIAVSSTRLWPQIRWMDFSNDGQILLTSDSFTVTLWDLSESHFVSMSQAGDVPFTVIESPQIYTYLPMRVTDDGLYAFTLDSENGEVVYGPLPLAMDAESFAPVEPARFDQPSARYFDASRDGHTLLEYTLDGLHVVKPFAGTDVAFQLRPDAIAPEQVSIMAVSDDVVVVLSPGKLNVWDANSGEELLFLEDSDIVTVLGVSFSPTGGRVAFVATNHIDIWTLGAE